MAFIKRDMKPILQKYAGFGYAFYYLYHENKVDKDDIENIFKKLNPDIASLYLTKVLRTMDVKDLADAFIKYKNEYTKEDCLKDYFGMENSKISLRNDIYETALNYRYTDKLLEELKEKSKDKTEIKIITTYQDILKTMIETTKESVVKTDKHNVLSKAR